MRSGDDVASLVGAEMSAVSFVRDYVEFHFDGPILRSLTDPLVRLEGVELCFADAGWRDALCSVIGSTIQRAEVLSGDRIELVTTDGKQLSIPLDDRSRVGPEAAHFVPAEDNGRLRLEDMRIW